MKKIKTSFLVAALGFMLAGCAVDAGPTASPPQIGTLAERTGAGVVRIEGESGGHGSGFAISATHVMTAAHVVDDAGEIFRGHVVTADGDECKVQALAIARNVDAAILRVTNCVLVALPVRLRALDLGEKIGLSGHPYDYGPAWSEGVVSALHNDDPMFQHEVGVTAPALPGYSGGAVVDAQGSVVGILVAGEVAIGGIHRRVWGGLSFIVPITKVPRGWLR